MYLHVRDIRMQKLFLLFHVVFLKLTYIFNIK